MIPKIFTLLSATLALSAMTFDSIAAEASTLRETEPHLDPPDEHVYRQGKRHRSYSGQGLIRIHRGDLPCHAGFKPKKRK